MFDSINVMPRIGRADHRSGPAGAAAAAARGFGANAAAAQVPENARELTDEALAELAALPDVKDVYPNLRVPVEVKYERRVGVRRSRPACR